MIFLRAGDEGLASSRLTLAAAEPVMGIMFWTVGLELLRGGRGVRRRKPQRMPAMP